MKISKNEYDVSLKVLEELRERKEINDGDKELFNQAHYSIQLWQESEAEIVIRTLECDICNRFDSIMIPRDEVRLRSKITGMGIGAYTVEHDDHTRIIYFDEDGKYLGDTFVTIPDDIPQVVKNMENEIERRQ